MGGFVALEGVRYNVLISDVHHLKGEFSELLERWSLDVREDHLLSCTVQGKREFRAQLPRGPDDEVNVLGHGANIGTT